jgi:hypothetical protein
MIDESIRQAGVDQHCPTAKNKEFPYHVSYFFPNFSKSFIQSITLNLFVEIGTIKYVTLHVSNT